MASWRRSVVDASVPQVDVAAPPRRVAVRVLLGHGDKQRLRGGEHGDGDAEQAHEVGALLGEAGTNDVVDGHLALTASRTSSTVWTSDPNDLRRLADHLPAPMQIRRV